MFYSLMAVRKRKSSDKALRSSSSSDMLVLHISSRFSTESATATAAADVDQVGHTMLKFF